MARTANADIEKRFYDIFAGWSRIDRTAALKVLATLHEHLPADKPAKAKPGPEDSVVLSNEAQAALKL